MKLGKVVERLSIAISNQERHISIDVSLLVWQRRFFKKFFASAKSYIRIGLKVCLLCREECEKVLRVAANTSVTLTSPRCHNEVTPAI